MMPHHRLFLLVSETCRKSPYSCVDSVPDRKQQAGSACSGDWTVSLSLLCRPSPHNSILTQRAKPLPLIPLQGQKQWACGCSLQRKGLYLPFGDSHWSPVRSLGGHEQEFLFAFSLEGAKKRQWSYPQLGGLEGHLKTW